MGPKQTQSEDGISLFNGHNWQCDLLEKNHAVAQKENTPVSDDGLDHS